MEEQETWFIRYKCEDCGRIFSEDCIVDEPECPECGSRDVTSTEKVR